VNGLGSVMRFLTAGAAGGSGLRAAKVFGARQFVARIVNNFIRTHLGWRVGTELGNLSGKNRDDEQQERLQHERSEHSPVGENTVRSFASQACTGAGKGGTDGGDELLPS